MTLDPGQAYERAEKEEKELFEHCTSRMTYLSRAPLTLKRLRYAPSPLLSLIRIYTPTYSVYNYISLVHTHTHTHTHTHLCCISLSLSHTHTLILSHTLSLSLSLHSLFTTPQGMKLRSFYRNKGKNLMLGSLTTKRVGGVPRRPHPLTNNPWRSPTNPRK